MNSFIAFTKKEFIEGFRTRRIYILGVLFLLLAIMSPAAAKLLPKIMEMTLPEGMNSVEYVPTAMDSWQQFFKNMGQMGMFVIVVMYCGMLTGEIKKGTLINLVTKGLNRVTIIMAKFTVALITWSLVYWVGFLIAYAYTVYYWSEDKVEHLLLMAADLWIFGILLLAMILFTSTLVSGTYGALLGTGVIVAAMLLIQVVPSVNKFNPIRLATDNYAVLSQSMAVGDLVKPLIVAIIMIVGFLGLACLFFHKKRL